MIARVAVGLVIAACEPAPASGPAKIDPVPGPTPTRDTEADAIAW